MKLHVVLNSPDTYFLRAISAFMSDYREMSLTVYSDSRQASEYVRDHRAAVDMAIGSSAWLSTIEDGGRLLKAEIADDTRLQAEQGRYALNIYQPGEDIVRDIKRIYADVHALSSDRPRRGGAKLLAFFSTQGGSGTTTLSYMTALCMARTGNVLYLNLETTPDSGRRGGVHYPVPMADILFHVKDGRNMSGLLLKAAVKNGHNMYTLPPFASVEDLLELTEEEAPVLLQQLMASGEYDVIVADLSAALYPVNLAVLQESDHVVLVYSGDATGKSKLANMQQDPYMKRIGRYPAWKVAWNRCERADAGADAIASFPYSQSVAKGVDPVTILSANPDFALGCETIARAVTT